VRRTAHRGGVEFADVTRRREHSSSQRRIKRGVGKSVFEMEQKTA